ncbi:MAG: YceH family protein [Thermodesulfovibrionia bacterium]|nr:YceH family protein [Thermodesulfovibrionia bacterium]
MDIQLDSIEVRILASLIEKKITTPDYYPLTLNSLTAACCQKSNRNPVVSFDEKTVVRGIERLQDKGLVEKIYKADSRVPKYQHLFTERFKFNERDIAILCELMLRGGQTPGELRSRAGRMCSFTGLEEVEDVLTGLMDRDEPVVTKLQRQFGRKEQRYMHLFSGIIEQEEAGCKMPMEPAAVMVMEEDERIASLESKVESLSKDFEALKKAFNDFIVEFK